MREYGRSVGNAETSTASFGRRPWRLGVTSLLAGLQQPDTRENCARFARFGMRELSVAGSGLKCRCPIA